VAGELEAVHPALRRKVAGCSQKSHLPIHVGFLDALQQSIAQSIAPFPRKSAQIDRNSNKARIFWTNQTPIPRLNVSI
jgi:hypothetical protein